MRAARLIPVLLVAAWPAITHADPPTVGPSATARSAAAPDTNPSNTANWADWDAQARIADGDYEGAVQAEQAAQAARKQADELAAQAPKHPPQAHP